MKIAKIFTAFCIIIILGCKKKRLPNPCEGLLQPLAEFAFKEVLNDTAFFADTVFRLNPVNFTTLKNYKSVLWKIGSDPRDFTSADFNLRFLNDLGSFNISFTGRNDPNIQCFPNDKGIYIGNRQLTIVEPYQKPNVTLSPMIGRFQGAFTNTPNDTFTVRIDYFDSTKYDVSLTGNKNFYRISNMPKGFRDTTSEPARQYPELSYGQSPNVMGYKSMEFGSSSNILSGKGSANLVNDTLKIYYFNQSTGRQLFIGKRI